MGVFAARADTRRYDGRLAPGRSNQTNQINQTDNEESKRWKWVFAAQD